MAKQMFEESVDIQPRKILSSKLKVQGQTFPFRRYGQSIDGRNTILFVKVVKKGVLPFRGPRPRNVRNKQKARFIKEDQMGPTSVGVFLYGTSGTASNQRSLPRLFVKLFAPASDSSTPSLRGVSTRGWDDIERRTGGRSLWLPGLRSINRSDTRQPEGHLGGLGQDGFFELSSVWEDGLASVGALNLEPLSFDRHEAIGILNSLKHSKPVLWLAGFCPPWTNGSPLPAPLFQLLWGSIGSHALCYILVEEIFPLFMQTSIIARKYSFQLLSEKGTKPCIYYIA
jgi:hypothetical protein